nr:MAG TPA: hypothetical protein [Caudoviricetes sp.]
MLYWCKSFKICWAVSSDNFSKSLAKTSAASRWQGLALVRSSLTSREDHWAACLSC